VLINLVGNAIKFTPRGGRVLVRGELHADFVEIAVEDTGRGIAREELPRLFDPFWRSGAEAAQTRGAGLGLAIAKGLVTAHGGTMRVDSVVGAGSTFTLPLAAPALPH